MGHPFFDSDQYPWEEQPAAKELWGQLLRLITDVDEIAQIYEHSGGFMASLDRKGSAADVWGSAIGRLAEDRKLRKLIDELDSLPRLKGNAAFHAAIRAVREATPTPTPQGTTPASRANTSVGERAQLSTILPPGADRSTASHRSPIGSPAGSVGRGTRSGAGTLIAVIAAIVIFVLFIGGIVAQNFLKIDIPWIPGTGQASSSEQPAGPEDPSTEVSAPIPRLQNGPQVLDADGVVTTIERVDQLGDSTELELTVQNNLPYTIKLFQTDAALASSDGTTIPGAFPAGDWPEEIPSGQLRRGTIVLDGALPPAATSATFSFSTVFAQGFGGPDSIIVPDLALAGLPQ